MGEISMPKGYWIVCYRSISNPDLVAEYGKLAATALATHGARYLARGAPTKTYEAGLNQRTVVIEFGSVEAAITAHNSPDYQAAMKVLNNAAERDFRILGGLE
jgi:uncharacterized protein (DUF1330 family)